MCPVTMVLIVRMAHGLSPLFRAILFRERIQGLRTSLRSVLAPGYPLYAAPRLALPLIRRSAARAHVRVEQHVLRFCERLAVASKSASFSLIGSKLPSQKVQLAGAKS